MEPITHPTPVSSCPADQSAAVPAPAAPLKSACRQTLYAFEPCSPDTWILVCGLLLERGYAGDSAAYILPHAPGQEDDRAQFFLVLSEYAHRDTCSTLSPAAILDEYGTRIAASSMLLCLTEHAVCLADHNALQRLAALKEPIYTDEHS